MKIGDRHNGEKRRHLSLVGIFSLRYEIDTRGENCDSSESIMLRDLREFFSFTCTDAVEISHNFLYRATTTTAFTKMNTLPCPSFMVFLEENIYHLIPTKYPIQHENLSPPISSFPSSSSYCM